ncbi:hypothetical protein ARMSODRAFT_1004989 [Armillaria solidipes]|uniref:F-box domain-containing protein n=1 Tax=Armillaria solidipes TaxID=1076256 RepID=A0A2H3BTI2_9AGAR|nr:hypothetical protein ARMSODRAFT_1004989 [Armillaria solidipes]
MALSLWPLWARRSASLGNLLRTNLPPSEQEANLRKTELSDVCDALEELDQKIEQAQTGASLLLKTVLSPVRRLAPEILMEIFRWATKGFPEGAFDITDLTCGPWVISHVSSLWREVVLSCSELWSCFYIERPDPNSPALGSAPKILNTALMRSGKHDLCVDYDYGFFFLRSSNARTPLGEFNTRYQQSSKHRQPGIYHLAGGIHRACQAQEFGFAPHIGVPSSGPPRPSPGRKIKRFVSPSLAVIDTVIWKTGPHCETQEDASGSHSEWIQRGSLT